MQPQKANETEFRLPDVRVGDALMAFVDRNDAGYPVTVFRLQQEAPGCGLNINVRDVSIGISCPSCGWHHMEPNTIPTEGESA